MANYGRKLRIGADIRKKEKWRKQWSLQKE